MSTLKKETEDSAKIRMTSVAARLDEKIVSIYNSYQSFSYTSTFNDINRSGNPTTYQLADLNNISWQYLNETPGVSNYAILFRDSERVVTRNGDYTDEEYFFRFLNNEDYKEDFWREEKEKSFAIKYYPVATFSQNSLISTDKDSKLMPLALKPYWRGNVMTVLFLDFKAICDKADEFCVNDFYLFSTDGTLLYSSEEQPMISELPSQSNGLFETETGVYTVQCASSQQDLIYVKLLSRSAIIGQVRKNINISIAIMIGALAFGLGIIAVSVWRILNPMQDILDMIHGMDESWAGQSDELRQVQSSMEKMMHQQKQYVQQLAVKDNALSSFFLQSQLKNIYVELNVPEESVNERECKFCILYFRIHYRQGTFNQISVDPSTVSYMLGENLQHTLSILFERAIIFQLEPNQFVAKASVKVGSDMQDIIYKLHRYLDNEQEYAFFTVVYSGLLDINSDYNKAYTKVLEVAQYARVEDTTQILTSSMDISQAKAFYISSSQEQQLQTLVKKADEEQVAMLTEQILKQNIKTGICRVQMVMLCSVIIGTVMRAAMDQHMESATQLDSSNIYNTILRCDLSEDYVNNMCAFVRSVAMETSSNVDNLDPILQKIHDYVESNYHRDFSMDELADTLHLSKNYLSTYYKKKTGKNLSDFIQFFRIQKAMDLLSNPSLKISDIGILVGLGSANTFLRQFKKYTGLTPNEYRSRQME